MLDHPPVLTSSFEPPLGYLLDVLVGAFQVEHLPVRYNGPVGRETDKQIVISGQVGGLLISPHCARKQTISVYGVT